jgi:hypothetical protein
LCERASPGFGRQLRKEVLMRSNVIVAAVFAFTSLSWPAIAQDTATQTPTHPSQSESGAETEVKTAAKKETKGWFGHKKHTANQNKMKQKALAIPSGDPVNVKTVDGSKVKGTLMGVSNSAVSVQPSGASTQNIDYSNIKSLKKGHGPRLDVSGTGAPQNDKLNASLGSIPQGSPVNFKLNDKTKVDGRYLGETGDAVNVQVPQDGKMTTRTIPKTQIAGVEMDKPGLFHKPKLESPELVKKRLSGMPVGSPLHFTTPNGQSVAGKLTGTTDTGFSVQSLESGNIVNTDYPYDQIASVKPPTPSFTKRIPGLRPPGLQSAPQIKTAAMAIPVGSPLTLQMPDGSKTIGKLAGVTNDGLQVQSIQGGNVATQNVPYDQIGSVQQGVPTPPSERAKKVGKAAAMVVVTGVISGALAR